MLPTFAVSGVVSQNGTLFDRSERQKQQSDVILVLLFVQHSNKQLPVLCTTAPQPFCSVYTESEKLHWEIRDDSIMLLPLLRKNAVTVHTHTHTHTHTALFTKQRK